MSIEAVGRRNYAGARQFFIVHPYDGIASALNPSELKTVARSLVEGICCPVDYVISLDGPALLMGLAVAMVMEKPLRVATKADLELPSPIRFVEPGSPNPVFLYNVEPGRVVLVDDEIRTGGTVFACIDALARHDVIVEAVVVPVGSTRFQLEKLFEWRNVPLLVREWHAF